MEGRFGSTTSGSALALSGRRVQYGIGVQNVFGTVRPGNSSRINTLQPLALSIVKFNDLCV